jgi:hypothetical protein
MTDHPGENPTGPTSEGSGQPEDSATPPPTPPSTPPPAGAEPPAAPAGPASTGRSQYDFDHARTTLQEAHKFDLGIIAAGVVAWLAGFMPFYTASVSAGGFGASTSGSAYHGFFGWFAVWVALAGAVAVAAALFGVSLPAQVHLVAVGAFALSLLCLIIALFVFPGGGCGNANGLGGLHCDTGHGFGYWLAVIAVLAGLGLAVMRMRETSSTAATS